MAFVPPHDRIAENSTSNSQSIFTVTGALDVSYKAFSSLMSVGDTTIGGVVEAGVAYKTGILTYSASNEVTVTTVRDSNGTFSSGGTKEVFMGQPALAALMVDGAQSLSSTQQSQARDNITAAKSPATRTRTVLLSGSGTYTPPAGCKAINVRAKGGGGGGGAANTSGTAGGLGGSTTFGTSPTLLVASGGTGGDKGASNTHAAGGTGTGGDINITGGVGAPGGSVINSLNGGNGGGDGAGQGGSAAAGAGSAAAANSGAGGGGGAASSGVAASAGGGGAGGYCEKLFTTLLSAYGYAVGVAGTSGTPNTGGAGGAGGSGYILIDEYY